VSTVTSISEIVGIMSVCVLFFLFISPHPTQGVPFAKVLNF